MSEKSKKGLSKSRKQDLVVIVLGVAMVLLAALLK
jgi:hypothetical protein